MDKNTLSHTTWECKYHIVFAPKFRRQIIYGNIKADVANILRYRLKTLINSHSLLTKQDTGQGLRVCWRDILSKNLIRNDMKKYNSQYR